MIAWLSSGKHVPSAEESALNERISSGSGEAILKSMVAGKAAMHERLGYNLEDAVKTAVLNSAQYFENSSCGVIALDAKGNSSVHCDSRTFVVATAGSNLSTRSGVVESTIPILNQLVCYEDSVIRVGMAKYPTMTAQLAMELKSPVPIAALDVETFVDVFLRLRMIVGASRNHSRLQCGGFIMTTSSVGYFYPLLVADIRRRGFRWKDWSSTSFEGQGFTETTWRLDNDLFAEIHHQHDETASPIKANIMSNSALSKGVFSLELDQFRQVLKTVWKTLRILVVDFQQCPASLRLSMAPSPVTGQLACVLSSSLSNGIPVGDPSPAAFQHEYLGFVSPRLGARAENLTELASAAQTLAGNIQEAFADSPWILKL